MKTTVNNGKRTALFWFLAATFFLSLMAHGSGAAKLGTLRNSDWVVTNAWIAASNRVDSFVSNYTFRVADDATNYVNGSISTNNAAFVAAVTNCPVVISAEDAIDLGDYGTFGTVGAALAALAAGLAALKRAKVTSLSSSSTDTQYPSAKCVWDQLVQKRGLGDLAVYAPSTFSEWVFTPLVEGVYLDTGPDWIATEEDFNESVYYASGSWDGAGWYVIYGIEGSGIGEVHPSGDENATELLVSSEGKLTRTVTGWTPASPADTLAKTSQLPTVPTAVSAFANDAGYISAAALPYSFVPIIVEQGVATVTPRTVATYTADSSAAAFTVAVGTGTTGAARDCVLVVDCTAAGAVAPTVTWGAEFDVFEGGSAVGIAPIAGKANLYRITEYANGHFVVRTMDNALLDGVASALAAINGGVAP